jgi:hypothetical protein
LSTKKLKKKKIQRSLSTLVTMRTNTEKSAKRRNNLKASQKGRLKANSAKKSLSTSMKPDQL